ncbi:hypothetical protein FACS189465_0600 [Clostridia bacterium]|nr:hypothetical protein FACS189465_0600 [Clostridia bacterium]
MTKAEKNRIKKKAKHKVVRRRMRKQITHRNGKPLLTTTMIRKLKFHINPLEQLIIIITKSFPWLIKSLSDLSDDRNPSYTEYKMQEITLIRLLALCCGIQSMTEVRHVRN